MNQKIKRKSRNIYSKIAGLFFFLTIIAIFAISHFALAKVTIKIKSNIEEKEDSVLVEMESESSQEISPDAIIGKIISTEFELESSVPSSKETVSSKKAGGMVTIYNNYSKDQPLVATTRLLTPDEKLFRITEGVTVPSGGQIKVWAEADQEGEEYITGKTTFIIPGLWEGLQDKIYAESTEEGMVMQSLPQFTVTPENIETAREEIAKKAEDQSLETINEVLSEKLKITNKQLKLNFETLESSQVGDSSKETYLKQKITAHGLVFDREKLSEIAQEKFVENLEGGQSLVDFKENNFDYSIIEVNLEKKQAVLEVYLTADISSGKGLFDINKQKLMGLNESEIRNYLKEIKVDKADVHFFPFWVKTAPKIEDHIIIE